MRQCALLKHETKVPWFIWIQLLFGVRSYRLNVYIFATLVAVTEYPRKTMQRKEIALLTISDVSFQFGGEGTVQQNSYSLIEEEKRRRNDDGVEGRGGGKDERRGIEGEGREEGRGGEGRGEGRVLAGLLFSLLFSLDP